MLGALTILLSYQLVGEVITRGFGLPIPGPVLGMALLFATLIARKGAGEALRNTSNGLLQHLSLLFVPAGTGVMLHFQRLADEWLALLVALAVSTMLSIAVSALVLKALSARKHGGARETITVRKVSFGIGVERIFPLHATIVDHIDVIRRGKVRRAKLYYLRDLRGKAARIKERDFRNKKNK